MALKLMQQYIVTEYVTIVCMNTLIYVLYYRSVLSLGQTLRLLP